MKYIVRVNKKAMNPITRKIIPEIVWEVEQVKTKDSPAVVWHSANVTVDETPIVNLFPIPQKGKPMPEVSFEGIAVRDSFLDCINIMTRQTEVQ